MSLKVSVPLCCIGVMFGLVQMLCKQIKKLLSDVCFVRRILLPLRREYIRGCLRHEGSFYEEIFFVCGMLSADGALL